MSCRRAVDSISNGPLPCRINVVGTSGSGKTRFSRRLAECLGVQHVEMDALYWGPGWRERLEADFLADVTRAVEAKRWVLDGNYSRTAPIKWARVDCVVWLDLPFTLTLARVTRRAIARSLSREELWSGTGNRESLRRSFLSQDSIIAWSIKSYRKNRRRYLALMADPDLEGIRFVRLRSAREAERFLAQARARVAHNAPREGY